MKECITCRAEKALTNFRWRRDTGKLRNECKACQQKRKSVLAPRYRSRVLAYMRNYRAKNGDRMRAYQTKWCQENRERKLNYGRARHSKHPGKSTAYLRAHPEIKRASMVKWQENNRHKMRAHWKVKEALRQGKLTRPIQCPKCNKLTKIEAHHTDYSQPLLITWLCRSCHMLSHRKVS